MIREALEQHATSSQKVWQHDRQLSIGASEIGQCARRVYYAKNEGDHEFGSERDTEHEDRWGAKVRGSVYEAAWWEPALRAAYGSRLLYAGDEQRTFQDGFLSATPDGLVIGLEDDALAGLGVPSLHGTGCALVECKSIDPRSKLDKPKPEHAYQVQVQLGLVRHRSNHQPRFAVLSYTCTSFWDEVKEFAIEFDPAIYRAALNRALKIMTARSALEVMPEGVIAGGKECEYCPFTAACGQARAAAVPEKAVPLPPEEAARLADLACKVKAAEEVASLHEQLARRLKQQIKDTLSGAGTKSATVESATGRVSVRWSAVKGRPSYDNKAIREAAASAGVDVDAYQTVGEPSDRLIVTLG